MSFGKTNYRNGGTRGGADQFKWDDVKNDKYRENYLGNSLHAPVGRWQKGKDLTWYAKLSKEDRAAALKDEIALAKQRDQELMNQALGIAPRKRVEPRGGLDAQEVKELLKRGASDREGIEAERVEGLGAAPVPQGFDERPKKTLAEKYQDTIANGDDGDGDIYALRGSAGNANRGEDDDDRARRKAEKKKEKKEKKAKKEKKEKKKEKKRRHRSDSSDEDDARDESSRRGRDRHRGRRSFSRSPSRTSSRSGSPAERRRRRSRSQSLSRDRQRRHQTPSRSRSRDRDSRRRSRSPARHSRRRSPSRSRSRPHTRDRLHGRRC